MKENIKVIKIANGPITITYRQVDGEWWCMALEFDLLGTGVAREEALTELKELVNEYLIHILRSNNKVILFNPAEREEWDNPDKERFDVTVVVATANVELPASGCMSMDEVRPLRENVREFDLMPTCACSR